MTTNRLRDEKSKCEFKTDYSSSPIDLSRLNAVRLLIVVLIGVGYASTMPIGPGAPEWLRTFGFDTSLYGLQILFFLSGWLALRSLQSGKSVSEMLRSRVLRTFPWVALYTLIVVAVLYPLLCDHDAPLVKGTADLALYFVKTVTLIDPGKPMPGALDGAVYMCLLQGTIWTLRIGAVAFIGLGLLWAMRIRRPAAMLALAIAATLIHHAALYTGTRIDSALLQSLSALLLFGHAFMLGVAAYAYRDVLPKTGTGWSRLFCVLFAAALLYWHILPWSQAIQTIAMLSYCAFAMMLLQGPYRWLQNWPNLVLPTYLGIWPITQTILYFMPDIGVAQLVTASLASTLLLAIWFKLSLGLVGSHLHGRVQTA